MSVTFNFFSSNPPLIQRSEPSPPDKILTVLWVKGITILQKPTKMKLNIPYTLKKAIETCENHTIAYRYGHGEVYQKSSAR